MDILKILAALSIPFLLLVVFLAVIVFQQRQRRRMGRLLLRVPLPRSRRVTFLTIGVVIYALGIAIVALIRTRVNGFAPNFLLDFVRGLFWGAGLTSIWYGMSSMEVREQGIWLSGSIEWSHVQSYQWQGSEGEQLVLDLRRKRRFSARSLNRMIPLNLRPTIEQILQQKLPMSRSV